MLIGAGFKDRLLAEIEIRRLFLQAISQTDWANKRVLILIPDGTRTAPISQMFRLFFDYLGDAVATLDYLIALGTHPPLSEAAIHRLIGLSSAERQERYRSVRIFNHRWDRPETFISVGEISASEIERITKGKMSQSVEVQINRLVLDYDHLIICGPVFPHEVVGFSGGNKYFFPGIGGSEVIDFSHWLGAILTSYEIIGTQETPVRQIIDRAASLIDKPKLCFSLVVKDKNSLAGLYIGSPEAAYRAAAHLSAQIHIQWIERPFRRALAVIPPQYDDLWTAAKGMYKTEPVMADGGEVIIYAPHINEVSYTHGHYLDEIGYHVRDYFLEQWDRFSDYPWGVLAHSTHLRGQGEFDRTTGQETPRIKVTLATGISPERCHHLNLGYLDPDKVDLVEWRDRESEGILFVPKAGEILYRLKNE